MNKNLDENHYYKIKQYRKNAENRQSNNPERTPRNLIIHRKKMNILFPSTIPNERSNTPYYQAFNSILTNNVINEKNSKNSSNFNYQHYLNFTNIEEDILFQRPKIKIKMHSLKHNNISRNTISSEKNNNQIKCKVHKIKANKSLNSKRTNILNLSKSRNKANKIKQKKINYNYNLVNVNQLDINELTMPNKNEKTFINYYNLMQESRLKKLSNHLDNLIGNKIQLKYGNTHSELNEDIIANFNDKNKDNENMSIRLAKKEKINNPNNLGNISVYRKKIQRKKNYDNNNNKNPKDNLLIKNRLKQNNNRTHKFICKRTNYQSPNNFSLFSNNFQSRNYKINQNKSILLSSLIHKENKNLNFPNEISVEDDSKNLKFIPKNKLIFNNNTTQNEKGNTFNCLDMFRPHNNIENYSLKRSYNTDLRYKKHFIIKTPKSSNLYSNSNNKDDFIHSNYENTLNLLGVNEKNNNYLNKNYLTLYSNNTSEYNTVNSLNNSEKNILIFSNENNCKLNNNKNQFIFQNNNLSQKKIYVKSTKNDLRDKKIISQNISKNKKLKNVITSIEYSNRNNNKTNKYLKDKNIILSEIDQNGKVNIKVREMKNSIEKILRENSFHKSKNTACLLSPKKMDLFTYIKKNQGTHIKKIKKHNTVNHIEFYRQTAPLQE